MVIFIPFRFWSQVCNDDSLHRWLDSLLETFPRAHESTLELLGEEVGARQQLLLHRLFLVFVRLCTYKESATDFFTPEYYGAMIYDKYIIEVPAVLDMCVLFGACNPQITTRMVANIFRCQPQYSEDLVTACTTMSTALDTVAEQFEALQLGQRAGEKSGALEDLVNYVGDISRSLAALLEVHSEAGLAVHRAGLDQRLAGFYHSVLVPLLAVTARSGGEELVRSLGLARHHMVMVYRATLNTVCLQPLLGGQDGGAAEPLEELLALLTSALGERSFITDYNARFPIRTDFELIEAMGRDIDSTRKHYILDAFSTSQTHGFKYVNSSSKDRGEAEKSSRTILPPVAGAGAAGPSSLTPAEESSLVSGVRDLLPHLGEGFVLRCLRHYGHNVQEVVEAVLEENLAPHLAAMDQTVGREPEPVLAPQVPRSVYEEDEFDVNTRDKVDMSRVHRGKKDKSKDAKRLLDDKTELGGMKDKFSKLGIVMEDVYYARGDDQDTGYDDEYDDTYDDVAVGQQEPDAAEEREFVLPQALGGGKIRPQARQEESEEEEEEEDVGPKNLNFARNPEEVRAERERKWQENSRGRGGRSGGGRGGGGGGPDVVGRAKGQGQDKSVLIARARKNNAKGKGQRQGADRKAAKGMF